MATCGMRSRASLLLPSARSEILHSNQLLGRNARRFRGGPVLAHRRVHHPTLGWRVMKKKKAQYNIFVPRNSVRRWCGWCWRMATCGMRSRACLILPSARSATLSIYRSIDRSIYLSIYLSIYIFPSLYLSVYLSIQCLCQIQCLCPERFCAAVVRMVLENGDLRHAVARLSASAERQVLFFFSITLQPSDSHVYEQTLHFDPQTP